MNMFLLAAALAAPNPVAVPVKAQAQLASDQRGHFETTPGPRGITRWVTAPAADPSPKNRTKKAYRLVQIPGPRGGVRRIEVKTADPITRHAVVADCSCSIMDDESGKMPCKMSMPTQPSKVS